MSEQEFERAAYLQQVKPEARGINATLINDNYVNKYQASISVVETMYSQSRFQVSLNNPSFGTTSQVYLPTTNLIGDTYLLVRLTRTSDSDTAAYALPQGWGLKLISSLTYTMPSDTIGQVTISNDELYHYLICQSKERASLSQLFRIMGPAQSLSNTVLPPTSQGASNAEDYFAAILLPLPWCSLGYDTKPMDASIFGSGQINLTFAFAQPGEIYSISNGGTGSLKIAEAYVTYRQGEMTNKEFGLKSMMLRNPTLVYDMPYIRSQYKTIGKLGAASISNSRVTTSVSGLLNADLVGMCITTHYVWSSSAGPGNPYATMPTRDLEVTFGGLTLYNAKGFSNKIYNFQSAISGNYDVTDITTGIDGEGTEGNPYIINFSRCRSMFWDEHYYNVPKWSAQTFNIAFSVPDDISSTHGGMTEANQVEVRVTMFYNAVFQLGQYRTQQRLL